MDGKLTFDVQLVLAAKDVPFCRLGGDGPESARLGVVAWLITTGATRAMEDTVLAAE